jgi:putative membrane protein
MIVRNRPSGLRLFLLSRGSILARIRLTLLVNILVAILVTLSHGDLFRLKITLTTIPFTLIGLPLAIFLGFRNNAAYDRYWEARKLWGDLVIRTRNLSRQCQTLIFLPSGIGKTRDLTDVRVRMVCRAIAYAHCLRMQLRNITNRSELKPLLKEAEWEQTNTASNPADYLIRQMGLDLQRCVKDKLMTDIFAVQIDNTLSGMTVVAASCERIKNTPIPFSYTLLLHRTAYIYCFLLPFGLVDSIGFMTPFVVGIVAYTFFGLDALGDEIEEPFGMDSNDLPLDAICRSIEINLLDSIGETNLPVELTPINYSLT